MSYDTVYETNTITYFYEIKLLNKSFLKRILHIWNMIIKRPMGHITHLRNIPYS